MLAVILGDADACVDYKELDNWWRSAAYKNDDIDHEDLCDRELEEGWYRAISGAGGDMPTQAPGLSRCGTVYPVWFSGL